MSAALRAAARHFVVRAGLRAAAQRPRHPALRCMATSAAPVPKYHVLEYKYIPEILERRGPFRDAHIEAAKKQHEDGRLVMVGALDSPPTGALFIFKNTTVQEIEDFVKNDPYVQNGLVPSWEIKPYAVVVGGCMIAAVIDTKELKELRS